MATYPPTDLQKDSSDSIQLTVKGVTTKYVLTSHQAQPAAGQAQGKEVLFIYKDGTGELAFSQAHKLGRSSGPAIAGIINWQCLP
jgi:basic membrane lipoprotein Med (substrate-binding protein (PBP1-ABC) superfamily)